MPNFKKHSSQLKPLFMTDERKHQIAKALGLENLLPSETQPTFYNRLTTPTLEASYHSSIIALLKNDNLLTSQQSHKKTTSEAAMASRLSTALGLNELWSGHSTFSGTMTLLSGINAGISYTNNLKINADKQYLLCFEGAHYCVKRLANLCGLIYKETNIVNLQQDLKDIHEQGHVIACLVCTHGKTHDLSSDPLDNIDHILRASSLSYRPYIHCDAVIKWSLSIVSRYADYFSTETTPQLARLVESLDYPLHLADSFGIDFHKSGFVPLTSSFFMYKKNKSSLAPVDIPYLLTKSTDFMGNLTLETSRPGSLLDSATAMLNQLSELDITSLGLSMISNALYFNNQVSLAGLQEMEPVFGPILLLPYNDNDCYDFIINLQNEHNIYLGRYQDQDGQDYLRIVFFDPFITKTAMNTLFDLIKPRLCAKKLAINS